MSDTITAADVAAMRNARAWSTYDLAKYLCCNQSTAWRIENGGPITGPMQKLLIGLKAEIESEAEKARRFANRAKRRQA